MSEPISRMMTRQVQGVGVDDTLDQVEALLARHHLHWVPVYGEQAEIVGVISTTDLLQARARGQSAGQTRAWQVCSYRPIVVPPDTPVDAVARLMVERRVHHVVVARDGQIEGVVSSLDFVRAHA